MRYFMVVYSHSGSIGHGYGSFYSSESGAVSINGWEDFVNNKVEKMKKQEIVIINYVEMEQRDWENCIKEKKK